MRARQSHVTQEVGNSTLRSEAIQKERPGVAVVSRPILPLLSCPLVAGVEGVQVRNAFANARLTSRSLQVMLGVTILIACHKNGQQHGPMPERQQTAAASVVREATATQAYRVWAPVDTVVIAPSTCCYSTTAFVVAVAGPRGWDTLRTVRTLTPHVLNDSVVVLRVVSPEQEISLQTYNRRSGKLLAIDLPPDYAPDRSLPEFSPAATLLAYEILDKGSGYSRIVVREWGTWRLVTQSDTIAQCGDFPMSFSWSADGRFVRWDRPNCEGKAAPPAPDSMRVPH